MISLFVGSHSIVTVLGVMDNHFSSEDFVNELWFRGCYSPLPLYRKSPLPVAIGGKDTAI